MAGSGTAQLRNASDVLLRVENITVEYPAGQGAVVRAVDDVSFDVRQGETLGLVGESGCGKSTVGAAIVRLVRATGGKVEFDGTNLLQLSGEKLRERRPGFQLIFQDPTSSLNPWRHVGSSVTEPLRLWARDDRARWSSRVEEILDAVGLDPQVVVGRRPHELSGGQLQRVCIARALILRPRLLIADEPVSALDVSMQAQILNLLHDMRDQYELTLIIVAHDLGVVKNVSNRVAVMYLGKLCEIGEVDAVYSAPAHPYTRALLDSVPKLRTSKVTSSPPVRGEIPSPMNPPPGCRFSTRCPKATSICSTTEPVMRLVPGAHQAVACHHPLVEGLETGAPGA
jgi:peptide/nickel transport system ATP-binding protein